MNRFRSLLVAAPLCGLVLFGQGCLDIGGTPASTGNDSGVFRTKNYGSSWEQLKNVNLGAKIGSLANTSVLALAIDPQDQNAMYAGTKENGLVYSLDGGQSWMLSKSPELSNGAVTAVAISPTDKCTVYAARGNQIFKTTNCERDWTRAFFHPQTDRTFTVLAIDWFNPANVYAGTSQGDVFRSSDSGVSWRAINHQDGMRISTIAMDPHDSRILYIGTYGAGIQKTKDSGLTWETIRKQWQDFDSAKRVTAIAIDPFNPNTIYSASKYGILKSTDAGATWKALALPTLANAIEIRALAIHPTNANVLVYATDSSLVVSTDGGSTWTPRKLPTTQSIGALLFDKTSSPALYLGVKAKNSN
ncbi:MAG TPA: hypothetical protein VFQ60_00090 [Patescibacteria group bacterium]|nr:hypothetical protein [Patescibacteria group bacterium]